MAWTPTKLDEKPVPRSDSGGDIACPICKSPAGQPCSSAECGTYDYDNLG